MEVALVNLERCKDQSSSTLEQFYSDADGSAMLALIQRLRAIPDERPLWGLTSAYHLCLLAENTSRSPWYVKFVGTDESMIVVEYLLPAEQAPWPNAYVTGTAHSIDKALEMILTGMDRSGGWPGIAANARP